MKNDNVPKVSTAELRRLAEEQLKEKQGGTVAAGTETDPQRLLHELQVHQIELEMQNAELRQARDDRETLLEQYTELYDFAPVGYLTIRRNGKIAKLNLTSSKLLGIDRSKLNGYFLKAFFTEESAPTFADFHDKVFSSLTKHTCEVTLLNEEGEPKYLQLEAIITASGEEYHLVVIDITERKQLEAEQAKLLAAIQQTEEMIVITDAEAKIQYVNSAFETITGYSSAEAIGQNPRILQAGDNDAPFYQMLWGTLTSGQPWKGRLTNKKKDGTRYTEEATISPIRDAQGKIVNYVAVKSDITERLHVEQQLRQKHKMEAVGYMAGGMAHNFNNNLSIILGNVELALLKQPRNSDVIPLLENAKIGVRRSRDLVQKIITYSRQGIQQKAPMQLTAIIDETLGLLQSTLPTTVTLQKITSPECDSIFIDADASQIQEVLINLCNNAIQAMQEKGDLKILHEPIGLLQQDIPAQYDCLPGRYTKLSVQDSGCGMPAEMLDKIFDPFYTTKEAYEGAGMGLATVQGIVAQHGGIIKVNSVPDQGTMFNLYFPIIEQTHIGQPTTEDTTVPRGTERILFVDDDEMLAGLGEKLLIEMGYQVVVMTESTEALKMFAVNAEHFNLVITDQTMPQLCGKDLIQELKKIRPDIPTILCTGYSSKIDEEKAKELGISAFMMKPLDLIQLAQTVRRVLDGGVIE